MEGDKQAGVNIKSGNVILRKISLEKIRQRALENYGSENTLSHEEELKNSNEL